MTNGDRIRAMTDEEMAVWVHSLCDCDPPCPCFPVCHEENIVYTTDDLYVPCEKKLLDWLKQEGEE